MKHFNDAIKLILTPKALKYVNSKKRNPIRLYMWETVADEEEYSYGYGFEYRGDDIELDSLDDLNKKLETMADEEQEAWA